MRPTKYLRRIPAYAYLCGLFTAYTVPHDAANLLRDIAHMVEQPGLGAQIVFYGIGVLVLWYPVSDMHWMYKENIRPAWKRRKAKREAAKPDYKGIPINKSLVRVPVADGEELTLLAKVIIGYRQLDRAWAKTLEQVRRYEDRHR